MKYRIGQIKQAFYRAYSSIESEYDAVSTVSELMLVIEKLVSKYLEAETEVQEAYAVLLNPKARAIEIMDKTVKESKND